MKDYSTGKIYAIRSAQTDEIYIGSTKQPLCARMAEHRMTYKYYLMGKHRHTRSFDILKHGDGYIELLENFPCISKEELSKREGELIRANKTCINKRIEGRSKQQYRQDNKDKISVKNEEYRKANKDKMSIYQQQYYQNNKDKLSTQSKCACGGTYLHNARNRHEKTSMHEEYMNSHKDTA